MTETQRSSMPARALWTAVAVADWFTSTLMAVGEDVDRPFRRYGVPALLHVILLVQWAVGFDFLVRQGVEAEAIRAINYSYGLFVAVLTVVIFYRLVQDVHRYIRRLDRTALHGVIGAAMQNRDARRRVLLGKHIIYAGFAFHLVSSVMTTGAGSTITRAEVIIFAVTWCLTAAGLFVAAYGISRAPARPENAGQSRTVDEEVAG